ncbi:MAG: CBS domain-containing protein [Kofleriaceae bacterium]
MRRYDKTPRLDHVMRRSERARRHASVDTLTDLLLDRRVGGVSVVDDDERLIGIVTRTDLLRARIDGDRAQPVQPVPPIDDVMTPFAFSLPADAPLTRAAALMAHEGVHRLVVTDGDRRPVGMVTSHDVMRWIAREAGFMVDDGTDYLDAAQHRPVMIVEDDADLLADYEQVIREEGYSVVTAQNGAEAIKRLGDAPSPGLIILDLNMPVMDGWTFRSHLLQDPHKAQIPVVLMSGSRDLTSEVSNLDVDGCLRKPVSLNQLLFTVEHYCRN